MTVHLLLASLDTSQVTTSRTRLDASRAMTGARFALHQAALGELVATLSVLSLIQTVLGDKRHSPLRLFAHLNILLAATILLHMGCTSRSSFAAVLIA